MTTLPSISTPIANIYIAPSPQNNVDNISVNNVNINNDDSSNNYNNNNNNNNTPSVKVDFGDTTKSANRDDNSNNGDDSKSNKNVHNSQLSDVQTKMVLAALKKADAEVRAHELAHMAAGGGLTGGVSYTYETGPDGKRYAVAGEVSIDTSAGSTPEETLRKAKTIKAAALAPANPSAQDRKVAAAATAMLQQATAQILQQKQQEIKNEIERVTGDKKKVDETDSVKTNANNVNEATTSSNNNSDNSFENIFINIRRVNQAISAYTGKEVFGA